MGVLKGQRLEFALSLCWVHGSFVLSLYHVSVKSSNNVVYLTNCRHVLSSLVLRLVISLFTFIYCKRVCSIRQWLHLYFECWASHRCSPRPFSQCIIICGEYFHDTKFSSLVEDFITFGLWMLASRGTQLPSGAMVRLCQTFLWLPK